MHKGGCSDYNLHLHFKTTKQNRNIYMFKIYLGSINLLFFFHFFNFVIKKIIQPSIKYYKVGLFQNISIKKNLSNGH